MRTGAANPDWRKNPFAWSPADGMCNKIIQYGDIAKYIRAR
jgi:hypothetical protein